jgi:hypothetical protein
VTTPVAIDEDRPPAFGQEANLDRVTDLLGEVIAALPDSEVALALVSAGLDVLPTHCADCRRQQLEMIRVEVDRLLAEVPGGLH